MENKTIVITVVVLLAAVLGLPALISAGKGGGVAKARTESSAQPKAAKPPEPVVPDVPPTLNAGNLAGSQWQVPVDDGTITVTLNGGGQATSTAPPKYAALVKQFTGSDTIQGTWAVSGSTLTVTASAMGRTEKVECKISGDQIYVKGRPATRLR